MALTNATVPINLDFHMRNIIDTYLGQTVNHIKVTKELDDNGLVISETQTESDLIAIISTVNTDVVNENLGVVQYGDLLMYSMSDDDVLVGEQQNDNSVRYDIIEYQSTSYTVSQHIKVAYDPGVPNTSVVDKLILRKIAYEA